MLEVRVLGSVSASSGGHDHPVGGARQRALLALLVMARGRPVSAEKLIAELWDESAPRKAPHALQARISRLRSALPTEISLIDGGYRLDPATFQTDAALFEALYEDSNRLLQAGERALAATHLHRALDLWRGHPFEGIPDISSLQVESVRLVQLRAAALADRIDLDLALGEGAAVVPELHALVEGSPFAERHWGQLMCSLYCDGRPQEALEVFDRARSVFVDRLGVEPSQELGRLHTGILRQEAPESLLRLPVAAPVNARLDSSTSREPDVDQARLRSLTSNDPDVVVTLLHQNRAVLVTGPAGIGKTHLLRTIATRFEAQHLTAPLLAASPLAQTVPLGVFAGTGDAFPPDWTTPAAVIDHYSRRRSTTVMLVDNIAHLDEASLFVVMQLIRTARLPTILTARSIGDPPDEVQSLYDSGAIFEIPIGSLSPADADIFITQMLGGPVTPDSRPRILEAAGGNPLHLREVIAASEDDGRLAPTEHGWELRGTPASSRRLTQVISERFRGLGDTALEAAAQVAIAGEYPASALDPPVRRALARADVVEYSTHGWLRLAHPLDEEFLRDRCRGGLWLDLSNEVLQVLLSEETVDWPVARRRAHVLALDLGAPIDPEATLAVAEHALGAFDERLALRAAEAVAAHAPENVPALRIAGLAASSLGMSEVADAHFDDARHHSTTAAEHTSVAMAYARHLGLRNHDASAALELIQNTLETVTDPRLADHLRRDAMRWAVVAGQGGGVMEAPDQVSDSTAVLGLITFAMSGVITGPLGDAERALVRLNQVPEQIIETVPGGASLIELTEIMALSNTGDVVAARRRLRQAISEAEQTSPETLGMWEYALGFSELLSGDVELSYELALSASAHLEWRDLSGLLPAAKALAGAAASATGRISEAGKEFDAIPETATGDPKVVMLRAWADARLENTAKGDGRASRTLLETARWMLAAQHSYFAGMLAHCAVRIGDDLTEAVELLDEAHHAAGGGLLELFSRHGSATLAGDFASLDSIASDAQELGMAATAADTWLTLSRSSHDDHTAASQARHWEFSAARLLAETPDLALWTMPA